MVDRRHFFYVLVCPVETPFIVVTAAGAVINAEHRFDRLKPC